MCTEYYEGEPATKKVVHGSPLSATMFRMISIVSGAQYDFTVH